MLNLDVIPLFAQVLRDKPAMTVMRRVFATKEAATIKLSSIQSFDLSTFNQFLEFLRVYIPLAAILLVLIEHVLSRRERRQVSVANSANFCGKEAEIVSFGETCQL